MKRKVVSSHDRMFSNNITNIRETTEHNRFSRILEILKNEGIIDSYKEFADNIKETSVGLNDIKKGRKKISINHVKNINIKYPFINTDFILFNEGLPFNKDYLIGCYEDGKDYASFYEFDMEAIKNAMSITSKGEDTEKGEYVMKTIKTQKNDDLIHELLATKNELLEAKDTIMKLQSEIYELKLKLPR